MSDLPRSLTYAEHRANRLWEAHDYEGWDRPPYPSNNAPVKRIGRVVMMPEPMMGRRWLKAGFYPGLDPAIEAHYRAKEKAQNRSLPK